MLFAILPITVPSAGASFLPNTGKTLRITTNALESKKGKGWSGWIGSYQSEDSKGSWLPGKDTRPEIKFHTCIPFTNLVGIDVSARCDFFIPFQHIFVHIMDCAKEQGLSSLQRGSQAFTIILPKKD